MPTVSAATATGASGAIYFDAFEARRGSTSGPLTMLRPSGGAKLAALAQPAGRMAGQGLDELAHRPKARPAALTNYNYGATTWTKHYGVYPEYIEGPGRSESPRVNASAPPAPPPLTP